MKERIEIIENAERIDKFLSNEFENLSRTFIKKLIKSNSIKVNDKSIKANYVPKIGDIIEIDYEEKDLDIKPEKIDLDILYEDKNFLVINKQKNLIVHPTLTITTNTLVNGLLYYLKDNLSTINGVKRPGIVHRLDKDTTGNIIIAKNDKAHKFLSDQFKNREVDKYYYALVHGRLDFENAKIDAPIGRSSKNRKAMAVTDKGSRDAITYLKVLKFFENYTLVELKLITGRTHQIRVHMQYINHPIVGDEMYGYKKNEFKIQRPLLHSKIIKFKNFNNEIITVESELPEDFQSVLALLEEK